MLLSVGLAVGGGRGYDRGSSGGWRMSRVTVQPGMLRWVRERAGRSVESLRERFPKYERWERSEAAPTRKQLEAFAKAVLDLGTADAIRGPNR